MQDEQPVDPREIPQGSTPKDSHGGEPMPVPDVPEDDVAVHDEPDDLDESVEDDE